MIQPYNFTLPWPPSANRYWRHVGSRVIISKEARLYKNIVKKLSLTWNFEPIKDQLGVSILVYPPDYRRRDLDNLLKITIDALNHTGLFKDDSQIISLFVQKLHVIKPGLLDISLIPQSVNEDQFLDKIH